MFLKPLTNPPFVLTVLRQYSLQIPDWSPYFSGRLTATKLKVSWEWEGQPSGSQGLTLALLALTSISFLGQRMATVIPLPGGMSSGSAAIIGLSL